QHAPPVLGRGRRGHQRLGLRLDHRHRVALAPVVPGAAVASLEAVSARSVVPIAAVLAGPVLPGTLVAGSVVAGSVVAGTVVAR
ncbi:hypothetical protein VQE80_15455, partial [Staphylococcus shinii]|uniref:hypothetical protein n=1 Tax=Staphylococcus shinii TaxID=2912228 RepID=UPI003F46BED7